MTIRLITGGPGSGKSYFMVKHLVDKYFDYNKEADIYKKKKEYEDVSIFTNIDELALDHVDLADAIKKSGQNIEGFFSLEYQKSIRKKYPRIVYIIDEAPMYFRSRFYNNDVFAYFEYHRHLGDDIYLIAIDRYKLSKEISTMGETEFRAVRRSLSFMGELKYNEMIQGEIISRKVLKPEKKIFNLYKSFTKNETENIKKAPLFKILIGMILVFPIAGCILFKRMTPNEPKPPVEKITQTRTTTSHKEKPKNIEEIYYVKIETFVIMNGKIAWLIDPIEKIKVDGVFYKNKILEKDQTLYAVVEKEEYERYIEDKKEKPEIIWRTHDAEI